MDYIFEKKWTETVAKIEKQFGEDIDIQGVLFLIGVQELGKGFQKFKKDEKVDLMHIALCTLLEPMGYYEFVGKDDDGWPHFKENESLPFLAPAQQEKLVKEGIVEYFDEWEPREA